MSTTSDREVSQQGQENPQGAVCDEDTGERVPKIQFPWERKSIHEDTGGGYVSSIDAKAEGKKRGFTLPQDHRIKQRHFDLSPASSGGGRAWRITQCLSCAGLGDLVQLRLCAAIAGRMILDCDVSDWTG